MDEKKKESSGESSQQDVPPVEVKPGGSEEGTITVIKLAKKKEKQNDSVLSGIDKP